MGFKSLLYRKNNKTLRRHGAVFDFRKTSARVALCVWRIVCDVPVHPIKTSPLRLPTEPHDYFLHIFSFIKPTFLLQFFSSQTNCTQRMMSSVSNVDVINPPTTTVASGFGISEPVPEASSMGIKLKTAMDAVINTDATCPGFSFPDVLPAIPFLHRVIARCAIPAQARLRRQRRTRQ
jgi:hypothetical protein